MGPVLTTLLFGSSEGRPYLSVLFGGSYTTLMVCGNSIPEDQLQTVPGNVVCLHYGFARDSGFTRPLMSYQNAGANIGICTGTGAWSNLAGAPNLMLENVSSGHASLAKLRGGVSLVAHWSSDPAFTHSVFAWPGFLAAAGLAWNSATPTVG